MMRPGGLRVFVLSIILFRMEKAKVLIVADEPQLSQAMRTHLYGKGYDVHCVLDGLGGLAHAQTIQPNVIVLDLNLPGIDDATVYEQIRKNPKTATTGIVFVTGLPQKEIVALFSDRGISDLSRAQFLMKPFGFDKLEKVVDAVADS